MTDFFSPDYRTSRSRFRSAVLANGGRIESILLDAKGPADEDLTIDIGYFGDSRPHRVLIHSSGLRGVEGFAGSAIQLQWLEEGIPQLAPDSAIVLVHAMNPYGMAWCRRVNENNVDLSLNFLDADEAFAGAPEGYAEINSWLNPESPRRPDMFWMCVIFRARTLRHCLAEGQYEFPRGLCFGGKRHEQAARRFQLYISQRLAGAERIAAIDVHTGPALTAESARGSLGALYNRMFPGADVRFEVQRFATCGPLRAIAALRSEDGRHLRDVFCPANKKWRETVLAEGRDAIGHALELAFTSTAADSVPSD